MLKLIIIKGNRVVLITTNIIVKHYNLLPMEDER